MKSHDGNNLSEPVYDHLVEMLLTGQLKPGDRVPENKIATQFGISRTPIREALRRLASEGVIQIYPNRYAEVTVIDDSYIEQLGQTRIALDAMFTKLAIYYGNSTDFARLQQLADLCTETTKTDNYLQRAKADNTFHEELARISRNQLLIKYQESLSLRVNLLVAWKYIQFDTAYDLSFAHQALVNALIARDEALAVKIAIEHLVEFYSLNLSFPTGFYTK